MPSLDFYVDFQIEVENVEDEFNLEAEQRLRQLAEGKTDIVGSSVALEKLVKVESPYLYQVRIVVYMRPTNIAVVEKGPGPMATLRNALSALERKIVTGREKYSEASMRTVDDTGSVIFDLTATEVYATYADDASPSELLSAGRTKIASKLMVNEGLSQQAAFFAADKILQAAEEYNRGQGSS